MTFNCWEEMYEHLKNGCDLYNMETETYVFVYNDAGALCTYNVPEEDVPDLVAKSKEDGEYWGAFLGAGGEVLDDEQYDNYRYSEDKDEKSLYLGPSFDFCKDHYYEEWEYTKDLSLEKIDLGKLFKAEKKELDLEREIWKELYINFNDFNEDHADQSFISNGGYELSIEQLHKKNIEFIEEIGLATIEANKNCLSNELNKYIEMHKNANVLDLKELFNAEREEVELE